MTEDSDSTYANQQSYKKSPSVLVSIADSTLTIFEIVHNIWPERFVELLTHALDPSGEQAQLNSTKTKSRITIDMILKMRDIVLKYMSGRTPIYKEVTQVMHIISFLVGKIDKKDPDFSVRSHSVVKWLDDLAKERQIEEPVLAKDVISLLIKLCASTNELDTIQNICEDIHLFTGDLDAGENGNTQMEPDLRYQIINLKTFSTITTQIFDFLDSSFDDLTWCIGRLKLCGKPTHFFRIKYTNLVNTSLFSCRTR
jgi:Fanconi anemia group I protein